MDKETRFHLFRICFVLLFLIIGTFIWHYKNINYANALVIDDTIPEIYFNELSSGINLTNAYPTTDEIGTKKEGYIFQIVNTTNQNKKFTIVLEDILDDRYPKLDYKFIRYQILKDNIPLQEIQNLSSNGILFTDEVTEYNTYEMKLWLDINSTNEAMGKIFRVKLALK